MIEPNKASENSKPETPVTLDYQRPQLVSTGGVYPPNYLKLIIGVMTLVVLAIVWSELIPRQRQHPAWMRCASNLRQIGYSLQIYSNENRGMLPPSFDEILSSGDLTSEIFTCSRASDDRAEGSTTQALLQDFHKPGHNSYVYVAKSVLWSSLTPAHVLAYENPNNHPEGVIFLHGDGRVDLVAHPEAARIIAELQAGHNPPSP